MENTIELVTLDPPSAIDSSIILPEFFYQHCSVFVDDIVFLQGDPNQNFLFQMALQLKQIIFDPMLVDKVKIGLRGGSFFLVSAHFCTYSK